MNFWVVRLTPCITPRLTPSPLGKGGLLLEVQSGFGAFLIVMQHRYNSLPPLNSSAAARQLGRVGEGCAKASRRLAFALSL
jgi:hypothetical protein